MKPIQESGLPISQPGLTATVLENIKEDLKTFVNETWRREMRELSAGLRREVCQELHRCFGEALGLAPSSRPTTAESCAAPHYRSPRMGSSLPVAPKVAGAMPNFITGDAVGGGNVSPGRLYCDSKQVTHAMVLDDPPMKPDAWGFIEEPKMAPPTLNVPVHDPIANESQVKPVRHSAAMAPDEVSTPPLTPPRRSSRKKGMRGSCASTTTSSQLKRTSSMAVNAGRSSLAADKAVFAKRRATKSPANMSTTHRFNQAMQAELNTIREHRQLMEGRFSLILRIVGNPYFDYGVFALLAINAAIIGGQVDLLASKPNDKLPAVYRGLNIGFTVVFCAELAIRWLAWGWRFFQMEDWLWNIFDISVVAFSILDEMAQTFLEGTKSGDLIDSMGVLRLLRVGRLARVVRMVRIIPTLKSMVYLIMASMPSFVWTVALMLMLMFCIAVYFTEVATELLRLDLGEPKLGETWGSVGSSIMSLWSAITGGDDWRNFTDVFGQNEYYQINLILFSLYISFAVLVMLNLVTGVFVDGMQRIIRDDREKDLVKTAVGVFAEADIDHNEDLSEDEFADVIDSEALDDVFLALGIQADEAGKLFHVLDTDKSGTLTLAEFVFGCVRLSQNARVVDIALSERSIKSDMCDLETSILRIGEDVLWVKQRLQDHECSTSPSRDEAPALHNGHHRENVSLYEEKQAVFWQQRYLCEWDVGVTDDA